MKIHFDLCRNWHGSHRCKKFLQWSFGKNKHNLSFLWSIPTKLWLNSIKMSKCHRNTFPTFFHFLSTAERLSNHIMTLTVMIWNKGFILILTLFREFQHFLTNNQICWFFLTFEDFHFFLTLSWPVGTLSMHCKRISQNFECVNFNDMSSSMEFHGTARVIEIGKDMIRSMEFRRIWSVKFPWHGQPNGIPWNLEYTSLNDMSRSKEFHRIVYHIYDYVGSFMGRWCHSLHLWSI